MRAEWTKKLLSWLTSRTAVYVVSGLLVVTVLTGVVLYVSGSHDETPEPVSGSTVDWEREDESYDIQGGVIDLEVYEGTVLPVTEDAGQEYLDETLFIGDSNTYRYMMYGSDDETPFTSLQNTIGVVSMGVGAITSLKCEEFEGYSEPVTIPEAVEIMQPRRIIIGFGTNNLSAAGKGTGTFIEQYSEGLAAIHEAYPYADIIVSAVPPLDKQRSNTSLSMTQVDEFNQAIVAMCEAEGYKFLDTSEALKDETTGWAKEDYTLSDGVHLSKKGVTAYMEYVRTHAYITEDTRPKPLKPIPEAKGTPPGLISQDPIAVRGEGDTVLVPVEFLASEGGYIEGVTSQSVAKGGVCSTVRAVANEGYAFSYWTIEPVGSSGGAGDTLTFTVPPDADANGVVIKAYFTTVAVDPQPAPTPTMSPVPSATPGSTATPEPATPEPATPEPATPEPATPEPATPEPATPEPATPQPATPQPATPEPATPQPATPEPATPEPATPEPATPQPPANSNTQEVTPPANSGSGAAESADPPAGATPAGETAPAA